MVTACDCRLQYPLTPAVSMCSAKGMPHIGGLRYLMSSGLIFRAAGAGGLQRAGKELGPGL